MHRASEINSTQQKMGSSQSSPVPEPSNHPINKISGDSFDTMQKPKRKPPKDLSGPQLVEYRCRKKKKAWSACVGSFYARFTSGEVLEDEQPDCDDLFDVYRKCYLRGMLKERQQKGLEPPKEGTILAEFADDEGMQVDGK